MNKHHKHFLYLIFSFLLMFQFTFSPLSTFGVSAASQDYVILSCNSHSMNIGDEFQLMAITQSGKLPKFKSSKSSVASVSTYGKITAKKSGCVDITAKVNGHEAHCIVTVLPTTIHMSRTHVSFYRTNQARITITTSSGNQPSVKSSRSSVVAVDSLSNKGNGCYEVILIGKKHGNATIKISCDGTTTPLPVTVESPSITLTPSVLTLKVGEKYQLNASVSSGVKPTWSVSNINVLSVTQTGDVYARQKGKAYVYAKEDGTKVSCIVKIIEP